MMNRHTAITSDREAWLDHLQNAIDRAFPSGVIPSRALAERWETIFAEAIDEQLNCDDGSHCEA